MRHIALCMCFVATSVGCSDKKTEPSSLPKVAPESTESAPRVAAPAVPPGAATLPFGRVVDDVPGVWPARPGRTIPPNGLDPIQELTPAASGSWVKPGAFRSIEAGLERGIEIVERMPVVRWGEALVLSNQRGEHALAFGTAAAGGSFWVVHLIQIARPGEQLRWVTTSSNQDFTILTAETRDETELFSLGTPVRSAMAHPDHLTIPRAFFAADKGLSVSLLEPASVEVTSDRRRLRFTWDDRAENFRAAGVP